MISVEHGLQNLYPQLSGHYLLKDNGDNANIILPSVYICDSDSLQYHIVLKSDQYNKMKVDRYANNDDSAGSVSSIVLTGT